MSLGKLTDQRIGARQQRRKKSALGRRNNLDKDCRLRENRILLECRGRWLVVRDKAWRAKLDQMTEFLTSHIKEFRFYSKSNRSLTRS